MDKESEIFNNFKKKMNLVKLDPQETGFIKKYPLMCKDFPGMMPREFFEMPSYTGKYTDYLFAPKRDGLRALVSYDSGTLEVVLRNGDVYGGNMVSGSKQVILDIEICDNKVWVIDIIEYDGKHIPFFAMRYARIKLMIDFFQEIRTLPQKYRPWAYWRERWIQKSPREGIVIQELKGQYYDHHLKTSSYKWKRPICQSVDLAVIDGLITSGDKSFPVKAGVEDGVYSFDMNGNIICKRQKTPNTSSILAKIFTSYKYDFQDLCDYIESGREVNLLTFEDFYTYVWKFWVKTPTQCDWSSVEEDDEEAFHVEVDCDSISVIDFEEIKEEIKKSKKLAPPIIYRTKPPIHVRAPAGNYTYEWDSGVLEDIDSFGNELGSDSSLIYRDGNTSTKYQELTSDQILEELKNNGIDLYPEQESSYQKYIDPRPAPDHWSKQKKDMRVYVNGDTTCHCKPKFDNCEHCKVLNMRTQLNEFRAQEHGLICTNSDCALCRDHQDRKDKLDQEDLAMDPNFHSYKGQLGPGDMSFVRQKGFTARNFKFRDKERGKTWNEFNSKLKSAHSQAVLLLRRDERNKKRVKKKKKKKNKK
jgi:hypothetical protein